MNTAPQDPLPTNHSSTVSRKFPRADKKFLEFFRSSDSAGNASGKHERFPRENRIFLDYLARLYEDGKVSGEHFMKLCQILMKYRDIGVRKFPSEIFCYIADSANGFSGEELYLLEDILVLLLSGGYPDAKAVEIQNDIDHLMKMDRSLLSLRNKHHVDLLLEKLTENQAWKNPFPEIKSKTRDTTDEIMKKAA